MEKRALSGEREMSNEGEKWKHWCNRGGMEEEEREEGGGRGGRSIQEQ